MAKAILKGAAWAFCTAFVMAIVLTLIVEANEDYWWYGPVWRINTLFGVAGVLVLGVFLMPVVRALRKK